jgi:lysophospholipase L1-like esterase
MKTMKKYMLKVCASLLLTVGVVTASHAGKMPQLEAKLESGQNTKIVFLGDSVTGGYGVNGDSYPRKFAQLLKSEYPGSNVLYYGKDLRIWPAGTYGAGQNTCYPAYSFDNPVNPEYIGGFINGARTITVIADGIGGLNLGRFMARLKNAPSEITYDSAGAKNLFTADDPFRADVPYTARDADAVFMMFGINDSFEVANTSTLFPEKKDEGLACYQPVRYAGMSLYTRPIFYSVFRYQYRLAIAAVRQQAINNPEIGLITSNRVGDVAHNQRLTTYYSTPASQLGWPTFDVTGLFNAQPQYVYNSWMLDPYHPNATGHQQIADLIFSEY